jgi:hypothetical protein
MKKFKVLQEGKNKWSSSVTEWLRELEKQTSVLLWCKRKFKCEPYFTKCCGGPDIGG